MLNPKTNQRELAYVTTIQEIRDLPGYDKVEYARVINWWCVVRKGVYKVGDLCVYFEIDSKTPETEPFEFLSKYKYRIKTQRLCKVLSQGLIMTPEELGLKDVNEGDFLTEKLGVTYYEPEDNVRKADNKKLAEMKVDKFMIKWVKKHKLLSKIKFIYNLRRKLWLKHYFKNQQKKKTDWPSWVVKTDEERCLGANTKVDTDQGLLRIADIVSKKLSVKVKSYNEKENRIEYKPITDYQHYNKELGYFEIKVPFSIGSSKRNKTIKCTADHKFYVGNGAYKKASELSTNDCLYTYSDKLIPTKIKEIKYVNKYMESYDIEVQDNHNFFAGSILTHNCQNLPRLFTNNDKKYIATEKIDGTSTTFTMQQAPKKKRKSYVCSRNVVFNAPEKNDRCFYKDTDDNVYLEMFEKYDINKVLNYILDKHPEYEFITIQGETYGGTIQKRNYGPEHRLAIFNYIYKVNGKAPVRLNPVQMKDEINSINEAISTDLEIVPILDTEFKLPSTCEDLLAYAEGNSKIDGKPREGIVFRDINGEESFKAVSNSFLEMFHQ